jgi:hypothetical protein
MTSEDPSRMLTMVPPLFAWGLAVPQTWPAHRSSRPLRGPRPLRHGIGSAGRARRGRCRRRSGRLPRRTTRCCSSTRRPAACRAIALLRVPIVGAVSVPGRAALGGMPGSAHRSPVPRGEAHLGLLTNMQDCVGHLPKTPCWDWNSKWHWRFGTVPDLMESVSETSDGTSDQKSDRWRTREGQRCRLKARAHRGLAGCRAMSTR